MAKRSKKQIVPDPKRDPKSYVPDVEEILEAVREKFGIKKWKRRGKPKKIHCWHEDYKENYVVLPAEWLGQHLVKRDEIILSLKGTEFEHSEDMRKLAISLQLADEIHIPSLGDDPEDWDIGNVPLPVLSWLIEVVFGDFLSATFIPKGK